MPPPLTPLSSDTFSPPFPPLLSVLIRVCMYIRTYTCTYVRMCDWMMMSRVLLKMKGCLCVAVLAHLFSAESATCHSYSEPSHY